MEADREAEFQAAWEAEEARWDEGVKWRSMVIALGDRLANARAELFAAEAALVAAIERTTKARELCIAIADATEAAARMVRW